MSFKPCPKCGNKEVEGEDLGDHPAFLRFVCDCGHAWSEDISDELMAEAQMNGERVQEDKMFADLEALENSKKEGN